eukprot:scaffold36820_cov38-Prasinocladus_malaysianus.AAC.1
MRLPRAGQPITLSVSPHKHSSGFGRRSAYVLPRLFHVGESGTYHLTTASKAIPLNKHPHEFIHALLVVWRRQVEHVGASCQSAGQSGRQAGRQAGRHSSHTASHRQPALHVPMQRRYSFSYAKTVQSVIVRVSHIAWHTNPWRGCCASQLVGAHIAVTKSAELRDFYTDIPYIARG